MHEVLFNILNISNHLATQHIVNGADYCMIQDSGIIQKSEMELLELDTILKIEQIT